MIEKIEIQWGSDQDFEKLLSSIENQTFLVDIFNHIDKAKVKIEGVPQEDPPMDVTDLVIHTDDYGGMKEWALMGFCNNILENLKLNVKNVWMCNPPQSIYEDIVRTYPKEKIIEHHTTYADVTEESLKKIANEYSENVVGQPHIIKSILPSIYSLSNPNRKRPVTILFLGDSGIGKTETATFIGRCIGNDMVRIQFSMQQTVNSAQYIFGGEHGEDSFARRLIRRSSNLILLDEFDKVSSGFYNAFYQMFDEGLFVDRNYSVDVSKCIIICTSNYQSEDDAEKNLGTPIFSRFSKVVKFKPISTLDRIKIARSTYKTLLDNLPEKDKKLIPEQVVLDFYEAAIEKGAYSNIRMLKNDMEQALYLEILKAKNIF